MLLTITQVSFKSDGHKFSDVVSVCGANAVHPIAHIEFKNKTAVVQLQRDEVILQRKRKL